MITVSQDPEAHLFYDVDWTDWLGSRGYGVNDALLIAFTLTGPGTISFQRFLGPVGRVWVKDIVAGAKTLVKSTITMVPPTDGTPAVSDDYSFQIFGRHK